MHPVSAEESQILRRKKRKNAFQTVINEPEDTFCSLLSGSDDDVSIILSSIKSFFFLKLIRKQKNVWPYLTNDEHTPVALFLHCNTSASS